jgi:hypothetical protein
MKDLSGEIQFSNIKHSSFNKSVETSNAFSALSRIGMRSYLNFFVKFGILLI